MAAPDPRAQAFLSVLVEACQVAKRGGVTGGDLLGCLASMCGAIISVVPDPALRDRLEKECQAAISASISMHLADLASGVAPDPANGN